MQWIVTADLHLDDKPQHSYRWGIFAWLAEQQVKHNLDGCLILGDLTDEKDCHSAVIVNKMVEGLRRLKPPVHILKGNHDYINAANPYFGFLSHIPGLDFIIGPKAINSHLYAVPHQGTQKAFDEACAHISKGTSLVLLHGLFVGAVAETGQRLTGLRASAIEKYDALAGDIHKPQTVGRITYVGAPYRVRFGDNYDPRVLLVRSGACGGDLFYPCPRKHAVTISAPLDLMTMSEELKRGDQVKVTLELAPEEAVNWAKHKQYTLDLCRDLGLDVFGIKFKLLGGGDENGHVGNTTTTAPPAQILANFCQVEGIPANIKKAGHALIHEEGDDTQRVCGEHNETG